MEFKLTEGDWERDSRGMPVVLEGTAAAVARIYNRLRIPRGSFVLQPELGSRLFLLAGDCPGDLEPQAVQFAQEALAEMPGVEVVSAEIGGDPPGWVRFDIRVFGEVQVMEVKL